MKKNYKIIIIVAVIIILVGLGFFVYQNVLNSQKEYKIEEIKNYSYFILKKDNKYGIIDKEGKIVVNSSYDNVKIPNPEKDVFFCYQGENIEVLNNKSEKIFTQYEKVEPIKLNNVVSDLVYEKTVAKYEKEGKFGLISLDGNKITDNIYESIECLTYREGELTVKQNGKSGVINIKGTIMVNCKYDQIGTDGYIQDNNDKKSESGYIVTNTTNEGYRYGYVTAEGKELIKVECTSINRVNDIQDDNNAYFILAKNGQYGIYKNQDEIIKPEYQSIRYEAGNDVFVIEKNKKYGATNREGKEIIPITYNQIDITGIYLYAKNDQGTIIYNKDGKQMDLDSSTAVLKVNDTDYQIQIKTTKSENNYGVSDKNGNKLISQNYSYIEYLYDNYFIACNKDGKIGVLDDKESTKIDFNYTTLQKIENTKLLKAINNNTGITSIYSEKMEEILNLDKAKIKKEDNYIKIYNDNETKYISISEEKEISNIEAYSNNTLFAKLQNGKWGFCDKDGNIKIEAKYDKVTEFNEYGFASIKLNNQWGSINEKGEIVVEPKYKITESSEEPSFIGEYYKVGYGAGDIYYTNI